MCLECAYEKGTHCPSCEACFFSVQQWCEECGMCADCVKIDEQCSITYGMILCEDCADESGEWVCVESADWDEHFAVVHTDAQQQSHALSPSLTWDWDSDYHWHACVYCDESVHITNKGKHTFDESGVCTVCRYVKNAKIIILVQPSDSKSALVTSVETDYDERNLARFSVKAAGKGKLTYTWYEGYYHYGIGMIKYTPLTDPGDGECYEGSEIYWLVPSDACCCDWYIRCVISDEYGNEVTTRDALV